MTFRRWLLPFLGLVAGGINAQASSGQEKNAGELRRLNRELLSQAESGQSDEVRKLLARGADANIRMADNFWERPLLAAASSKRVSTVEALLNAGAAINATNDRGETALMVAGRNKSYSDADELNSIEVMKFLIRQGANIHLVTPAGDSALSEAAEMSADRFHLLLKAGAVADFKVLFNAVAGGQAGLADQLIAAGISPRGSTSRGQTLMHAIAQTEEERAIEPATQALWERLSALGLQVDQPDQNGETPLHAAVARGELATIEWLLKKGADPNRKTAAGATTLQLWFQDSYGYRSGKVLRVLVMHGMKLNERDSAGHTALDTLLAAARWTEAWCLIDNGGVSASPAEFLIQLTRQAMTKPVPRMLLDASASQMAAGAAGLPALNLDGTPLIVWWCILGTPSMVQHLLNAGADANSRDKAGMTPLMWARRLGNAAVTKVLLENGANAKLRDGQGLTAAAWAKKGELARGEINRGRTDGLPEPAPALGASIDLMDAIARDRIPEVKQFLQLQPEALKQTRQSYTPLQLAVVLGRVDIARMLVALDSQAARDQTQAGHSLADLALSSGSLDMVRQLVESGIVSAKELIPAALHAQNDTILQWLLDRKTPLTPKEAEVALSLATGDGRTIMVRRLLDLGAPLSVATDSADPFGPDARGSMVLPPLFDLAASLPDPEILKMLLGRLSEQEKQTSCRPLLVAALRHAAEIGNLKALSVLLDEGSVPANAVQTNTHNSTKYTALGAAVSFGQIKVARFLLSHGAKIAAGPPLAPMAASSNNLEMLRLIIAHGADVNARGDYGKTALHVAAELGNRAMVEMLLAAKADATIKDDNENTPAKIAHEIGEQELVELLTREPR